MLPSSHIAYTLVAFDIACGCDPGFEDVDLRLLALAATGPDLIDKPLAAVYFYRRFKSAVLFAHTLLAHGPMFLFSILKRPWWWLYGLAFAGHAVLDRLWFFPKTFYWPFLGWRFHEWKKEGSEQEDMKRAYWRAFTRRPELWAWEVGGGGGFVVCGPPPALPVAQVAPRFVDRAIAAVTATVGNGIPIGVGIGIWTYSLVDCGIMGAGDIGAWSGRWDGMSSTTTVTIPNVEIPFDQIVAAIRQLGPDARSDLARVLVDAEMDARMAELITSLVHRVPADAVTDADVTAEVHAVRGRC